MAILPVSLLTIAVCRSEQRRLGAIRRHNRNNDDKGASDDRGASRMYNNERL